MEEDPFNPDGWVSYEEEDPTGYEPSFLITDSIAKAVSYTTILINMWTEQMDKRRCISRNGRKGIQRSMLMNNLNDKKSIDADALLCAYSRFSRQLLHCIMLPGGYSN